MDIRGTYIQNEFNEESTKLNERVIELEKECDRYKTVIHKLSNKVEAANAAGFAGPDGNDVLEKIGTYNKAKRLQKYFEKRYTLYFEAINTAGFAGPDGIDVLEKIGTYNETTRMYTYIQIVQGSLECLWVGHQSCDICRPRSFLETGFRPVCPSFVWYLPLSRTKPAFWISTRKPILSEPGSILVDGFDTRLIPRSFSCGI